MYLKSSNIERIAKDTSTKDSESCDILGSLI